jgi:hypothetical protein
MCHISDGIHTYALDITSLNVRSSTRTKRNMSAKIWQRIRITKSVSPVQWLGIKRRNMFMLNYEMHGVFLPLVHLPAYPLWSWRPSSLLPHRRSHAGRPSPASPPTEVETQTSYPPRPRLVFHLLSLCTIPLHAPGKILKHHLCTTRVLQIQRSRHNTSRLLQNIFGIVLPICP